MHTVEKNGVVKAAEGPAGVWFRYIEAWNKHDIDGILALVSESFTYDECPMTMRKPIKGKKDFAAYLKNVFKDFPDLHIEIVSLDVGKISAWSESILSGTYVPGFWLLPGFRRRMVVKVACAFQEKNGRLITENLYWDKTSALRQFGVLASLFGVITQPVWRP